MYLGAGKPQRSNIQGPSYTTMTAMGPNQYRSYFVKGKSSEPFQQKAYGQLKRQRDQFHEQTRALIPGRAPAIQPYYRYPNPLPASLPGQVRASVQPHFSYQRPNFAFSRARMPELRRIVTSSPNPSRLPGQAYYRNAIPQRQASFRRLAHAPTGNYGYPQIKQARIGRAVNNRKPQPQTLLTSLTAAATRLVVPDRPEPYDMSWAESVWTAAAPRKGAHAVRSTAHPGNVWVSKALKQWAILVIHYFSFQPFLGFTVNAAKLIWNLKFVAIVMANGVTIHGRRPCVQF